MIPRRRLAASLLFACATFGASSAHAASAVEIHIAASDEGARATEAAVRELLARLDVRTQVDRVGRVDAAEVVTPHGGASVLARIWIDRSEPDRATIYVVDSTWERVLVRHVPQRGEDEMATETIAHILETSVDALLHGARIGVERSTLVAPPPPPPATSALPPPPPSPTPPLAPPAEPAFAFAVAALYAIDVVGPSLVEHGPALAFSVALQKGVVRPGLRLAAQYRFPAEEDEGPVGLRFRSIVARAHAFAELGVATGWMLRVGAGGGLDDDIVEPIPSSDPTIQTAPADHVTTPFVSAFAETETALGAHFTAIAGVSLDADPSRTRYLLLRRSGAEDATYEPYVLRPSLYVGVAFR